MMQYQNGAQPVALEVMISSMAPLAGRESLGFSLTATAPFVP